VKEISLPPEWRAQLREERRQAKQAADNFVRICRDGEADRLHDAHLLLNECTHDAWRLAMARVARLPPVSPAIQDAFILIWVESKMLPLRVGHRPTLAAALRVLMPGGQLDSPLTLYRGTTVRERRRRLYGFSWTTDAAVARGFAQKASHPILGGESGGVVLRTCAPPAAVLLIRQPEEYYDEGEVVVDPYRLGKIEVVEHVGGAPSYFPAQNSLASA
jgi:hypothetical protein